MPYMFARLSAVVCVALLIIAFQGYRSEKGHHSFLGFIHSSSLRGIAVEVLSVILATTLAISCAIYSEKRADKDYTIAILEQERLVIDEQYQFNEAFLKVYERGEMTSEELGANLKCESTQIEYLLQNDTVVSCISPSSFLFLSDAKRVLDSCDVTDEQQQDDQDYLAAIKTARKWLVMVSKMIGKEIEHQKGSCTAEDVNSYKMLLISENFELEKQL